MAICKGCEHFTGPSKYFSGGSCKKCGCSFKAKASMRTERCPLGKWPKLSS
jgi:hypothetical protein